MRIELDMGSISRAFVDSATQALDGAIRDLVADGIDLSRLRTTTSDDHYRQTVQLDGVDVYEVITKPVERGFHQFAHWCGPRSTTAIRVSG